MALKQNKKPLHCIAAPQHVEVWCVRSRVFKVCRQNRVSEQGFLGGLYEHPLTQC